MRNLHIFKNTNEKFSEPFIDLINDNFSIDEHIFFIQGEDYRSKKIKRENVFFIKKIEYFSLVRKLYEAEKIFLHALLSPNIIIMLFLQPWLLKKCFWIIWGGDLYAYLNRKSSIKNMIREIMRAFIIKRFSGLITHVKGDFELAKKWYSVRGNYFYSFLYPSNLFIDINTKSEFSKNDQIYVQVGNSADPSNNHIEVFLDIKKTANIKNMKIIVPLSYGDKEYAKKVIETGKRLFGKNFEPLLEFIPNEEYLSLLANIDVAVFNHHRQQALGNIISLISMEKKVYIRDDITTWQFCKDHNLIVYSTNNGISGMLEKMNINDKKRNYYQVKNQFSKDKLVSDWAQIFNE